jgi:hypothetical protein
MDTAEEVAIVVRFSNHHPDLRLSTNTYTLCLSLKTRIRNALDEEASHRRLKLIHGGKVLRDGYLLSTYIRGSQDSTVFISCSIGELLTSEELNQEQENEKLGIRDHITEEPLRASIAYGFDRLLGQGFTSHDIQELRVSFLANLARSNGILPEGEDLCRLEDEWLDAGAYEPSSSLNEANDAADEAILGFVTGLVWPVALIVTARGSTAWSERRRNGIMMGVATNAAVGLLRWMSVQTPGT